MWHLINIKAKNIVSFKNFELNIKQKCATLIFGQNNDSDKQKNNGSGKSSLVEAISFGITGEPLRKVNTEEIINDNADEAEVTLCFQNNDWRFEVCRNISRNRSQIVSCAIYSIKTGEEIMKELTKQPSVIEYNKFILDMLGMTKSELYNNYILCANKYKSFFKSSDREKKEIINTYSNGVLVDECLTQIESDLEPKQKHVDELNIDLEKVSARVNAIEEQISDFEKRGAERMAEKQSKIVAIESKIRESHDKIAENRGQIRELNKILNQLIDFEDKACDLEESDTPMLEAYDILQVGCKDFELNISDYALKSDTHLKAISDAEESIKQTNLVLATAEKELKQLKKDYDNSVGAENKALANEEKAKIKEDGILANLSCKEEEIQGDIEKLQEDISNYDIEWQKCEKRISKLKAILHGVIECPKCKYRFLLDNKANVDSLRSECEVKEVEAERHERDKASAEKELLELKDRLNNHKLEHDKIALQRSERAKGVLAIAEAVTVAQNAYNKAKRAFDAHKASLTEANEMIEQRKGFIQKLRPNMFDEFFGEMDAAINKVKADIKLHEQNIQALTAGIETYTKMIDDIQKSTDDDYVEPLKKSLEKYKEQQQNASQLLNDAVADMEVLKTQYRYFTEFKSHLANAKINAMSQITNAFLEQIGSDLKVELSGYKVLRSGKIRENITVQILRDGIDCGSFDKLSGGERARICLANILAMHNLTNLNCEMGKGLDLLVVDEVLDCSDESGIASYCDVLNNLQVTSMIITQGLVSESYPNRIMVVKENGISTIQ